MADEISQAQVSDAITAYKAAQVSSTVDSSKPASSVAPASSAAEAPASSAPTQG